MDISELAKLIDLSCVRADHEEREIREMAATAKKYKFVCAFALPAYTELLVDLVKDEPAVRVGGVVGFPGGGTTTANKVAEARELLAMGVRELDMVINIGWVKSGLMDKVRADVRAVVEAAKTIPVKVILECHYLTPGQIVAACDACVESGVAFVKTGTGWAPTGATLENTKLMVETVKGRCGVKAAGGVRDRASFDAMRAIGVSRFGIGIRTALSILGLTGDGGDGKY